MLLSKKIGYTCDCDDNTILTDKGVCMLKCTKDDKTELTC